MNVFSKKLFIPSVLLKKLNVDFRKLSFLFFLLAVCVLLGVLLYVVSFYSLPSIAAYATSRSKMEKN